MNIQRAIEDLREEAAFATTNNSINALHNAAHVIETLHRGFLALYRKGIGDGDSRDINEFFREYPELEPCEK